MNRSIILCFIIFCNSTSLFAGTGLNQIYFSPFGLSNSVHASRFNVKIQPAIYWSSLGIEAEYVVSPKVSLAINIIGRISGLESERGTRNNVKINNDFLETGYMAEIIGRYYITLSKKHLTLAPIGFYIQAAVGFNKLLYFDGSTRPFSLNTRYPHFFSIKRGCVFFSTKPSNWWNWCGISG